MEGVVLLATLPRRLGVVVDGGCRLGERTTREVGPESAGLHDGDRDAKGREFAVERTAQSLDGAFGGRVVARSDRGDLRADRRDVDDGARPASAHPRQHGLDHRDRAEEVRLEKPTDIGIVALLDGGAVPVPGVVDQDVDAAESAFGLCYGARDLLGTGDVEGESQNALGSVAARSATFPTSRAVTTTSCPAAMTDVASARPKPVEQPVISQVDMSSFSVGEFWSSTELALDQLHLLIGVMTARRRRERIESRQLRFGQHDLVGGDVLFQPRDPSRPRNRRDVSAFGEQPRDRDLSGCRADLVGHVLDVVGDRQIAREVLAGESRLVARKSLASSWSVDRMVPVRKPLPRGE